MSDALVRYACKLSGLVALVTTLGLGAAPALPRLR